jgi:hypothetical protein
MEDFGKASKEYLDQIQTFKSEMLEMINSKKKRTHSSHKKHD